MKKTAKGGQKKQSISSQRQQREKEAGEAETAAGVSGMPLSQSSHRKATIDPVKRETNAQRREREYNLRTTLGTAKWIAETICERRKSKADLAPGNFADLSAKELKRLGWHPETKRWIQTYIWLGQMLCEFSPFDEAPSTFLRLIADFLEGKPPPYSPAYDWYDSEITKAYREAVRRRPQPVKKNQGGVVARENPRPSFSEFLAVFREQNPKIFEPRHNRPDGIAPSERSLRRSLERLGYRTRPDKRGRPRKK